MKVPKVGEVYWDDYKQQKETITSVDSYNVWFNVENIDGRKYEDNTSISQYWKYGVVKYTKLLGIVKGIK